MRLFQSSGMTKISQLPVIPMLYSSLESSPQSNHLFFCLIDHQIQFSDVQPLLLQLLLHLALDPLLFG